MAHIAAILAEEIGADVATARAGALLHDIGKTVSQEVAGTHVEIGIRILKKYDVDERVILAMRAHHEEYPYETLESMIVQVADAISGGRPGARVSRKDGGREVRIHPDRAKIANRAGADLFVSIHANSAVSPRVRAEPQA